MFSCILSANDLDDFSGILWETIHFEANNVLRACCRKTMTPQKPWTLLSLLNTVKPEILHTSVLFREFVTYQELHYTANICSGNYIPEKPHDSSPFAIQKITRKIVLEALLGKPHINYVQYRFLNYFAAISIEVGV